MVLIEVAGVEKLMRQEHPETIHFMTMVAEPLGTGFGTSNEQRTKPSH